MKAPVVASLLHSPGVLAGRSRLQRYTFALVAFALAFGIRYFLDGYLKDKHVFLTFIVATTLVAWYSGFFPSVLTFLAGIAVGDYFFLSPRHSFAVHPNNYLDTILPPFLVGVTIILFGRSMHLARDRADENLCEALTNQEKLQEEVADRKRAEEEVRRLNAELEQRVELRTAELLASNQELEAFTYSVSHDLRAPLRHVDGYAQILEEEFGSQMSPEAQKFAHKIRQGSQNMGRLVDDLLNLSRVGKKDVSRQAVDLNQLVETVIAEVKPEIGERRIEWQIGELPSLNCDPGLIKVVLVNLISNAVKYTRPRDKAVIEVGQKKVEEGAAIFVRDNGVGFNMKYSGKLFGVFQRLHRVEEFEGTGVGLATVARIIRKHGGRIWAEAEINKGAAFYFTLPEPNGKTLPVAMPSAVVRA